MKKFLDYLAFLYNRAVVLYILLPRWRRLVKKLRAAGMDKDADWLQFCISLREKKEN